jgi:hypothetical protein
MPSERACLGLLCPPEETQSFSRIRGDPALLVPIENAMAEADFGPDIRQWVRLHEYGLLVGAEFGDAISILIIDRLTTFVLRERALPWHDEGKRSCKLWRLTVDSGTEGQYRKAGCEPQRAGGAGNALMQHLEKITDPSDCASWE